MLAVPTRHAPGAGGHDCRRRRGVDWHQQRAGPGQPRGSSNLHASRRPSERVDPGAAQRSPQRPVGGDLQRRGAGDPRWLRAAGLDSDTRPEPDSRDGRGSQRGHLGRRPVRGPGPLPRRRGHGDDGRESRSQAAVHGLLGPERPHLGRVLRRHAGDVRRRPRAGVRQGGRVRRRHGHEPARGSARHAVDRIVQGPVALPRREVRSRDVDQRPARQRHRRDRA